MTHAIPVLSHATVQELDGALRRLRRTLVKPPQTTLAIPSLGRPLDFAKVLTCEAIHDLAADRPTLTVKDVADALHLQHSTVSRLLTGMEADGLILRREDNSDRRRALIELTDVGEAVVADATAMTTYFMRRILTGWDEPDVRALSESLHRLADSVHAHLPNLKELAHEHFCAVAENDATMST